MRPITLLVGVLLVHFAMFQHAAAKSNPTHLSALRERPWEDCLHTVQEVKKTFGRFLGSLVDPSEQVVFCSHRKGKFFRVVGVKHRWTVGYAVALPSPKDPFYESDITELVEDGLTNYFGIFRLFIPLTIARRPGSIELSGERKGITIHYADLGSFGGVFAAATRLFIKRGNKYCWLILYARGVNMEPAIIEGLMTKTAVEGLRVLETLRECAVRGTQ